MLCWAYCDGDRSQWDVGSTVCDFLLLGQFKSHLILFIFQWPGAALSPHWPSMAPIMDLRISFFFLFPGRKRLSLAKKCHGHWLSLHPLLWFICLIDRFQQKGWKKNNRQNFSQQAKKGGHSPNYYCTALKFDKIHGRAITITVRSKSVFFALHHHIQSSLTTTTIILNIWISSQGFPHSLDM